MSKVRFAADVCGQLNASGILGDALSPNDQSPAFELIITHCTKPIDWMLAVALWGLVSYAKIVSALWAGSSDVFSHRAFLRIRDKSHCANRNESDEEPKERVTKRHDPPPKRRRTYIARGQVESRRPSQPRFPPGMMNVI
jgi:hypothetical protein